MRPITLSQHRRTVLPTERTFSNQREGEGSRWKRCLSEQDRMGLQSVTSREMEGNTCFGFQGEISVTDGRVSAGLGWQVSVDSTTLPSVLCILCACFKWVWMSQRTGTLRSKNPSSCRSGVTKIPQTRGWRAASHPGLAESCWSWSRSEDNKNMWSLGGAGNRHAPSHVFRLCFEIVKSFSLSAAQACLLICMLCFLLDRYAEDFRILAA